MILPAFLIDHPDGEIRLTGHRIGLYTIVRDYQEGRSAEEIVKEYPTLPVDLIREVIAFYMNNRSEVDAYIDACERELERQAAAPPGPGTVRIRELMSRIQEADRKHGDDLNWSSLSPLEKLFRIEQENNSERA
jgi:uncharacterized protein (DUF433 family)